MPETGPILEDRRRFIRLQRTLHGSFRILDVRTISSSEQAYPSMITDICAAGCRLDVAQIGEHDLGELLRGMKRLALTIELGREGGIFRSIGLVRWCEKSPGGSFGMGVAFGETTQEDDGRIRKFIVDSLQWHYPEKTTPLWKRYIAQNFGIYLTMAALLAAAAIVCVVIADGLSSYSRSIAGRIEQLEAGLNRLGQMTPDDTKRVMSRLEQMSAEEVSEAMDKLEKRQRELESSRGSSTEK